MRPRSPIRRLRQRKSRLPIRLQTRSIRRRRPRRIEQRRHRARVRNAIRWIPAHHRRRQSLHRRIKLPPAPAQTRLPRAQPSRTTTPRPPAVQNPCTASQPASAALPDRPETQFPPAHSETPHSARPEPASATGCTSRTTAAAGPTAIHNSASAPASPATSPARTPPASKFRL